MATKDVFIPGWYDIWVNLDIIFVCYLVQRRIYRVDKNRLALSTGSIDLSKTVAVENHIKN